MPQPPPGEARSPLLRLLPLGRLCEFPGCGGNEGRGEAGGLWVRGSLSLPNPRPVLGRPPPACSRPAILLRPRGHWGPQRGAEAGPSGVTAAASHLCSPGSAGPAVRCWPPGTSSFRPGWGRAVPLGGAGRGDRRCARDGAGCLSPALPLHLRRPGRRLSPGGAGRGGRRAGERARGRAALRLGLRVPVPTAFSREERRFLSPGPGPCNLLRAAVRPPVCPSTGEQGGRPLPSAL